MHRTMFPSVKWLMNKKSHLIVMISSVAVAAVTLGEAHVMPSTVISGKAPVGLCNTANRPHDSCHAMPSASPSPSFSPPPTKQQP